MSMWWAAIPVCCTIKTGPYVEQIMPGAFKKALAADSKVELRFNHKKILDSEDLELREDNIGLRAHAVVTDSEVIAAAEQKELRGWSFGFVKQKDHWKTDEEGTRRRFVDELELREVSIWIRRRPTLPPALRPATMMKSLSSSAPISRWRTAWITSVRPKAPQKPKPLP